MTENRKYADIFDILRMLAMVMVFSIHIGQRMFSEGTFIRKLTNLGGNGVPIFFVLSGYLIFSSLQNSKSIKEYCIKRIFRIVPLYYSVLLFAMAFYWAVKNEVVGIGWIKYFTFTNNLIPSKQICWQSICGFWTLTLFVLFYLLAPLFYKVINSPAKAFFCFYLGVLIAFPLNNILIKVFESYENVTYQVSRLPHNYFYLFFLGVGCQLVINKKKMNTNEYIHLVILTLFSLGLWIFRLTDAKLLASIISIILIIYCVKRNYFIKSKGISIIVKAMSKYSFTIYLVHILCFDILEYLSIRPGDKGIFFISSVGLILVVSYLLNKIVEVPSGKIMKKILT